jgi:hypothetical protein
MQEIVTTQFRLMIGLIEDFAIPIGDIGDITQMKRFHCRHPCNRWHRFARELTIPLAFLLSST